MVVGVVRAAVGFLASDPTLAAFLLILVMPAILIGCAVPFLGSQDWRNKPRNGV